MPIVILLLIFFAGSAPAAERGSSVAEDRCQQKCSLERANGGRVYVACNCTKRVGVVASRGLASLAENPVAGRKAFPLTSVPEAAQEIARCEGGANGKPREFHDREELLAVASQQTRPLCECVAARVHLPVVRSCVREKTGATSCAFAPDFSRVSIGRPLRRATLEDYQSCLMAAANYRRPDTCADAAKCSAKIPACDRGLEAVNIADPQACCPVFVCRKESV